MIQIYQFRCSQWHRARTEILQKKIYFLPDHGLVDDVLFTGQMNNTDSHYYDAYQCELYIIQQVNNLSS